MKRYILIGFLCLVLDQISKYFLFNFLVNKPFGSVSLLPFFNLSLVINKGVSFGFLNNIPNPHYLISTIVICIVIALIILFLKEESKLKKIALVFLISGAVGNTIDRFFYGGVVDFLDFHIKNFHYPAFNLADSIIFVGIFILLFPNFVQKILRLKDV